MANITNNPFLNISDLQQQMQRFWNEALSGGAGNSETVQNWYPTVDIYETDGGDLVLMTELPGMKETDFKLSTENNVLTISGERNVYSGDKKFNFHRKERPEGQFQRSFSFPSTVDLGKVSANYKNGILSVTLPKKAEARPRSISVTVK
jgi:HSP20 family protein